MSAPVLQDKHLANIYAHEYICKRRPSLLSCSNTCTDADIRHTLRRNECGDVVYILTVKNIYHCKGITSERIHTVKYLTGKFMRSRAYNAGAAGKQSSFLGSRNTRKNIRGSGLLQRISYIHLCLRFQVVINGHIEIQQLLVRGFPAADHISEGCKS